MSASSLSTPRYIGACSLARGAVAVLVRHFVLRDVVAVRYAAAIGDFDSVTTAEAGLALSTHEDEK